MRRVLGVVLATLACGPAAAAVTPRIVGGVPAPADMYPWAAGLKLAVAGRGDDRPDSLCAGTLIAARWVLTAAHCLNEATVDTAHSLVILGATNLDTATPDQQYRPVRLLTHPASFGGTGGSDVGLVELDRPAPLQPLRLIGRGEQALYGPQTAATVAGWGYTEDPADNGVLSTDQLRAVDVRVYGDRECRRAFAAVDAAGQLDLDSELCAAATGKDACNGDSGGPLMVADPTTGGLVLAGAVSFGIGNGRFDEADRSCNEGPPGVYSRLGAQGLNAFVRAHVPQVDIAAPATVYAGRVGLRAVLRAPGQPGPFGGYDTLRWDLDGDNRFEEATDRLRVRPRLQRGIRTVGVVASDAAGDQELRTLRLAVRARPPVAPIRRVGRAVGRAAT